MNRILRITLVASMAALAVVLDYIKIPITQNLRITFYALPLLFAGLAFNSVDAILTGIVCAVLSQIQYGFSLTTVFWALAPVAWCYVSHEMFNLLHMKKDIFNCLITVVIASITANLLNTMAMYLDTLLVGDSWYTVAQIVADIPARLLIMGIMIVPYTLLIYVLKLKVLPFYKKEGK